MKKIFLILGLMLALINPAQAEELYHNISIEDVYNQGDWSSQDEIKHLVNEYSLFLELQENVKMCPIELPDCITCYEDIVRKILKNFYTDFDNSWSDYINFKQSAEKAYETPSCHDRLSGSSGSMCYVDTMQYVAELIKNYATVLLSNRRHLFEEYYPFLHNYKP